MEWRWDVNMNVLTNTAQKNLKKIFNRCRKDNPNAIRNFERIGELERKTALSENDLNHIKSTLDEMNNNIKTLMAVPGKRYDTIIVCIITAIVSAAVGFIINGILPV